MIYHGRGQNGVVVLENDTASLSEGTLVGVTPLPQWAGSPAALLAAMAAEPHVTLEDVAELRRAIATCKRPAVPIDPFAKDAPGPVE